MILIPVGMMSAAAGGGGGGGFSGALDSYTTGLWFTGGIKRLLTSYTGSLLRVRRSSDSAEMDVGYNAADGTLDTVTMLAWSGADSVFVVRVYDQSGSGNYFQQATTTKQPRLVNAGTYDGFMRWDGTDDALTSFNTTPTVVAMTVAGRYALRALSTGSATSSIMTLDNLGPAAHNTFGYQQQGNQAGKVQGYIFTSGASQEVDFSAATTSEVADLVAMDRGAAGTARVALYRGGSAVSVASSATGGGGGTAGNYTAETMYIGSYNGSQQAQMNGKWFAVWSNSQAANGAAITSAL